MTDANKENKAEFISLIIYHINYFYCYTNVVFIFDRYIMSNCLNNFDGDGTILKVPSRR